MSVEAEDRQQERIPMSAPDITDDERQAVAAVLQTPRLSLGPQAEAFEAAVAEYVGARHAISVSSGTAGLHLCVRAAGISDGDTAITSPFSFVASSNVLLYERAVPVFVDVDPSTGNLDPVLAAQAAEDLSRGGSAAAKWLPRRGAPAGGALKSILAVDVFGQPADYANLDPIVKSHGLTLIEDSCEALGSAYQGRPAGMLGHAGVFAFYPNKQLTTGEGGVILTNDDRWAETFRALRNQGRAVGDQWLDHSQLGYNYRLPEISATLGLAQMRRLESLLAARDRVASWYDQALEPLSEVERPVLAASTTKIGWFVYVIRLQPGLDRGAVAASLESAGVPTRPYFPAIHLQSYMVDRFGFQPGDYPITEDLAARGLALPFSGVMTEAQVGRVAEALALAVRQA
jgi:dTDP-4-amino-4,6-dideoxygalactose transaminase